MSYPYVRKFTHPVLSHLAFRSAIFQQFKINLNSWEITHNSPHPEESVTSRTSQTAALTPTHSGLQSMQLDNKKIINQNPFVMNTVANMSKSDAQKHGVQNTTLRDVAANQTENSTSNNASSNTTLSSGKLKKNRCKRVTEEIKCNNNQLYIVASGLQKISEIWKECKCGLNGRPALKDLECLHGSR